MGVNMSRDSQKLLSLFVGIAAIPIGLAGFIIIRYSLTAFLVLMRIAAGFVIVAFFVYFFVYLELKQPPY
jgi:hypothetical protein